MGTVTTIKLSELTNIVRNVVDEINNIRDFRKLLDIVFPIRRTGITPNIHVGAKDWENNDSKTKQRMTLEWYAGSILDIVDKNALYAMNSIINCKDKFAPVIKETD